MIVVSERRKKEEHAPTEGRVTKSAKGGSRVMKLTETESPPPFFQDLAQSKLAKTGWMTAWRRERDARLVLRRHTPVISGIVNLHFASPPLLRVSCRWIGFDAEGTFRCTPCK